MNIAVFGGMFNPPTVAHQEIMNESLNLNFVDELWVMPSGQRHDKITDVDSRHRLDMVQIAIGDLNHEKPCHLVDFEINTDKLTRTVDTVRFINDKFPDHSFWYVFGMDSYKDMPNWDYGNEMQRSLNMIIVERSDERLEPAPNLAWVPLDNHLITSSTEVRNRIANNMSINNLVCEGVRRYIEDKNLYR